MHQRYSIDVPFSQDLDTTITRLQSQTIGRYRTNLAARHAGARHPRQPHPAARTASYQTLLGEFAGGCSRARPATSKAACGLDVVHAAGERLATRRPRHRGHRWSRSGDVSIALLTRPGRRRAGRAGAARVALLHRRRQLASRLRRERDHAERRARHGAGQRRIAHPDRGTVRRRVLPATPGMSGTGRSTYVQGTSWRRGRRPASGPATSATRTESGDGSCCRSGHCAWTWHARDRPDFPFTTRPSRTAAALRLPVRHRPEFLTCAARTHERRPQGPTRHRDAARRANRTAWSRRCARSCTRRSSTCPQPVRWTVGQARARGAASRWCCWSCSRSRARRSTWRNRTELVARELTLLLNHTLAQHSDLVLKLRDIKGNPLTGFRAIEPRVRFRSDGAPLLEAHEMRICVFGARAAARWRGPIADHHGPRGRAPGRRPRRRAGGCPRGGRDGASRPRTRGIDFGLVLRNAELVARRGRSAACWASTSTSRARPARAPRVELEHLSWTQGPWHSRLDQLAADLTTDGRFGARARSANCAPATLHLQPARRAGGRAARCASCTRTSSACAGAGSPSVFDNDDFDVPGEGRIRVDALGDARWRGRFSRRLATGTASPSRRAGSSTGMAASWRSIRSRRGRSRATSGSSCTGRSRGGCSPRRRSSADPSHWHALHLDDWPAGKLNGAFRYTLDSRTAREPLAARRATCGVGVAGLERGQRPRARRLPGRRPRLVPRRRLAQRRPLHAARAHGDEIGGWSGPYTIDEFPLDEWPDGRASGLRGHARRTARAGSTAARARCS